MARGIYPTSPTIFHDHAARRWTATRISVALHYSQPQRKKVGRIDIHGGGSRGRGRSRGDIDATVTASTHGVLIIFLNPLIDRYDKRLSDTSQRVINTSNYEVDIRFSAGVHAPGRVEIN